MKVTIEVSVTTGLLLGEFRLISLDGLLGEIAIGRILGAALQCFGVDDVSCELNIIVLVDELAGLLAR
jgi:hypothetical protein